jgi:hypothetical protein
LIGVHQRQRALLKETLFSQLSMIAATLKEFASAQIMFSDLVSISFSFISAEKYWDKFLASGYSQNLTLKTFIRQ